VRELAPALQAGSLFAAGGKLPLFNANKLARSKPQSAALPTKSIRLGKLAENEEIAQAGDSSFKKTKDVIFKGVTG